MGDGRPTFRTAFLCLNPARRAEMSPKATFTPCGTCIYVAAVGLLLLVVGLATVDEDGPAAGVLFLLGGGAMITAAFVSRIEGSLRIGPLHLTLKEQVIKAASAADERTLEGVLPLLTSNNVSITTVSVPSRFDGTRLIDEELSFLRKQLNVTVLGVQPSGQNEWVAGGVVSEHRLQSGDKLLLAGHPDVLDYVRLLFAADDDTLWDRVR
jgi:hypothetical protein